MSFDIGSVGRRPSIATDTATVDTIPASLPPEVRDAIGVADQAYHNLKASGSELRFKINEATGKLTVEVHDVQGNLTSTVPASTVLSVASGQPISSSGN
jgi:hypothetical protein